ncbi:MAG: type II secretion system protein N [Pseudomonadota bacterium]
MAIAQSLPSTLAKLHAPVRFGVELVLVICLAIFVARVVWLVASPSDSVATYTERPLPSPMRSSASGVAVSSDRTILVRSNPFETDSIEPIIQDAPETNLNLHLAGLRMSTSDAESGNAIIRTPDGNGKNYSVGDEILSGVTLQRILSDRVIINRDGADETLMLGGRGPGLSVISDDSQIVDAAREAARREEASSSLRRGGTSDLVDTPEVLLRNPESLFANINARPVASDGRVTGYRLEPLGSADAMRELGLEPGDVLQQINGTSVDNLDIGEIIDEISSAETADLQLSRNGAARTIRLRFGE